MLEVSGLTAGYGPATVIHGISFSIGRGEAVAALGRNGAGKSTTIKALVGMVRRAAETLRFDGTDISRMAPQRIARLGLGYVPEERRVFPELTVAENLEVGRQAPREGAPHWPAEKLYELFPELGRMQGRRAGRMSGGEQQMLTIARTLAGNPKLLLLDEPAEGLAPVVLERIVETVKTLKAEGLTLLIAEQNLGFAAEIAERCLVIENGALAHEGAMAAFMADAELRRRYLAV
ncbi:MAG: ABC transporter ATP-binding protein [Rhizobiales bacterium NRL2]|jgi:branched-chain amino acid transport system ATP-binding protein|nr:MAG: ABC transporter ATP-binding protein [Rhizobiales bacterium NRL2]